MKFRKKPVVIEAVQYDGKNYSKVYDFCRLIISDRGVVLIPTLEGRMTVSVGDWVIKGVKGEFYPCKPDIFEATYSEEPVFSEPTVLYAD